MDAKPRAPVCLSASPSWAPQGTRDRRREKGGGGELGGRRGKLRGEIDTVEGANKAGTQELNRSAV